MRIPLLLCLFGLLPVSLAAAEAPTKAGQVSQVKGAVFYHPGGGMRGQRIEKPGLDVHIGDQLRSKRDAQAVIRLLDDSKVVLSEQSVITFTDLVKMNVDEGIVVFDIQKQQSLKGLRITTKTATIGVKGTRFAVQMDGDKWYCFMDEGNVTIESNTGEFKRFLSDAQREYNEYKREMRDEYEKFKSEGKEEFIIVKEFDLEGGKAVSIGGGEVHDIDTPDHIKGLFKELGEF